MSTKTSSSPTMHCYCAWVRAVKRTRISGEGLATPHPAKNALALHLLLQGPESLIDIVIANEYPQTFPIVLLPPLWAVEMWRVTNRGQRTLRLSADSLPRLLTT